MNDFNIQGTITDRFSGKGPLPSNKPQTEKVNQLYGGNIMSSVKQPDPPQITRQSFDQWISMYKTFSVLDEAALCLARQAWSAAIHIGHQTCVSSHLPRTNDALTRNMTDHEFLRHVDSSEDKIVIELARRLALVQDQLVALA